MIKESANESARERQRERERVREKERETTRTRQTNIDNETLRKKTTESEKESVCEN